MVTATDLRALHGRVVLVKSSRDRRNPPTAMRGWMEVHDAPGSEPEAVIAVQFPQMFTTPAHLRVFRLDAAGLERLLGSGRDGTLEYTVDEELLPEAAK